MKPYVETIREAGALVAYAVDPSTAMVKGRWDRWRDAHLKYYNVKQVVSRGTPARHLVSDTKVRPDSGADAPYQFYSRLR